MKCLIVSQGPVPAPEHTKVEGGGLRCWGLAKGLHANNPDLDITIVYHESYKKDKFTKNHEGIHIGTWTIEKIPDIVAEFDSIIVSYCMGDLSVKIADEITPDQQLILDCYVPIYVEASARETANLDSEYYAFHADVGRWAHVLRRGDLFLCASEEQRRYYNGVLSGIGRVNPATYGQEMILVVPYGIYREVPSPTDKPITKMVGNNKSKKILWFGGIYPWFDLRVLVDSIKELNRDLDATLIIVGAKNPFNTHPDFTRRYDELVEHIKTSDAEKFVKLQDWVKFEDRINWYMDSDVVVVVNKLGPENDLAWRTRLVDFAWANIPIITNGGDPFGEKLLREGAAARFSGLTKASMASDLLRLFNDSDAFESMKTNLANIRTGLYWDVVTQALTQAIESHIRPQDFEKFGIFEMAAGGALTQTRTQALAAKARKLPGYMRRHGIKNTYSAVHTIASRKIKRKVSIISEGRPRIAVVSHQLDISGAPFVIIDFVRELRALYPKLPIDFYTFNPAHNDNITALNKIGIRPKILIDRNAVIDLHQGDVVIFNTAAQSGPLKEAVFSNLESGKLAKLIWYIHEDNPELLFSPAETRRIHELMHSNKLEMFTAATQTKENYQQFFHDTTNIKTQYYKLSIPKKYHRVLPPQDFSKKISFILPGTMGDGRKGQLPVFYAFAAFLHNYYRTNPELYRDFELVYIGMAEDFLSRQIMQHAEKALGKHLRLYGRTDKEDFLKILLNTNVTICYSMSECLPLFVFEGMIAGHPVLRNDSSGMKEQLMEGKNGWKLDSMDFWQVVETIEKLLNRQKTSDEDLARMSKTSYDLAHKQEGHTYKTIIESARRALK